MSHILVLCVSVIFYTCDMYKSSLRHIHDPVLLSQDRIFFFFCSTFNSSNNFTIPDTDMCWENVGVTRIGAYRIFLVSSLLQGHKFWRWVERKLLAVMVDGLFGF